MFFVLDCPGYYSDMEIDLIPLSQLPSRYNIARSNLYTRLKDLNIQPTKQGRKAFVTAAQLQLLDGLHHHLQQGGITSDFLQQQSSLTKDSSAEALTPISMSSQPIVLLQPTALVGAIEAVVKRLLPPTRTTLSYLRELEEAYQQGWLLSTSEIAGLLGLTPATISRYGEQFEDAGFVFTRVGIRKGGEIAWSVDKSQVNWNQPPSKIEVGVKEAFSDTFAP